MNPTLQQAIPVFLVADIAATMRWYESVLGFTAGAFPIKPPHTFCILRRDDVSIFLQQLDGYEKPDVYHRRSGGVWSAYLRTKGVRALYASLRNSPDLNFAKPLRKQPYGETEFELVDPNGYVLVFAETEP
jgi:catechol 2,3-dioxygenase-like lactoylglutathione lyase family enzyme